jgi:hypothetical protein
MSSQARPYANVCPRSTRFQARRPNHGRQNYLGTFDNAQAARIAVSLSQAEHLEGREAAWAAARAAAYRAEVLRILRLMPADGHHTATARGALP